MVKMIPGLGEKYDIEIETVARPKDDYMTDEYFELDLPVAPAVMVGDEIVVEGAMWLSSTLKRSSADTSICRNPAKKAFLDSACF
jgi:hypothetical protein